ncbi:AraC family transcriptional regulator [Mycobacterium sp. Aquia_216]|uniref:AraC family transcriptional regulator n=1 Tax=Mycobacterium sp. Aquia_216 TaxID=2991729 RepID=UPI00227A6546|nr:AraC family transcriptional regulator [Mycobacterium sp. Aquia_216]WAJ46422.1 AraC family transcriptional regulator [Mycobacterium sp. Aquia_216]
MTAKALDDFAVLCCREPHVTLRSNPDSFSLGQRAGRIGPVILSQLVVRTDTSLDCGERCSGYRVNVVQAGCFESTHRGSFHRAGPGTVGVYQPEGHTAARWTAGTRMLGVKLDRSAVEDALSDTLGRQVTSQLDLAPFMPTTTAAGRDWINMLLLFYTQISRPDGLFTQPLVALPFADSLIRGFLLAVDHPDRDAVAADALQPAPRTIRAALEIIDTEAHLPLTVSALAARTHVSARSLQQGFRSHLDVSPMEYLRQVRLRRAHQELLDSDPSSVTVSAVAYRWGFTNPGRFAAAHAKQYGESPSESLRRTQFRAPRNSSRLSSRA